MSYKPYSRDHHSQFPTRPHNPLPPPRTRHNPPNGELYYYDSPPPQAFSLPGRSGGPSSRHPTSHDPFNSELCFCDSPPPQAFSSARRSAGSSSRHPTSHDPFNSELCFCDSPPSQSFSPSTGRRDSGLNHYPGAPRRGNVPGGANPRARNSQGHGGRSQPGPPSYRDGGRAPTSAGPRDQASGHRPPPSEYAGYGAPSMSGGYPPRRGGPGPAGRRGGRHEEASSEDKEGDSDRLFLEDE